MNQAFGTVMIICKKKHLVELYAILSKIKLKKKTCQIIEANIACMYQQPCHTGGGLQFQIYHLTWKKTWQSLYLLQDMSKLL